MTETTFATLVKDTDRAPINMTHGHTALRVSKDEASRVNDTTMRRLLTSRKLFLVVDLDQTIIQATDHTCVAMWQGDPTHPNHHAVQDVRYFQLPDDGPAGAMRWYYIKLRPRLTEFLAKISELYELHIYTMGTRAYAENIVNIIDPDRRLFGDRVLSRDESGCIKSKSLYRLFPCDTKMVVVIDDRGDVWNWSDNVIKVVPYDFFGIGDINSTFLPKGAAVPPTVHKKPLFNDSPVEKDPEITSVQIADLKQDEIPAESQTTDPQDPTSTDSHTGDDSSAPASTELESQLSAPASVTVDDSTLVESHPASAEPTSLEQKIVDIVGANNADTTLTDPPNHTTEISNAILPPSNDVVIPKSQPRVLLDEDIELDRVEDHLIRIHSLFFSEFDRTRKGIPPSKIKPSTIPDVAHLISDMRFAVLEDVDVVFTGIIPLGVNIYTSAIVRWTETFGATVSTNIHKDVTHVIASPDLHTTKLKQALATPRIKVVTLSWLYECLSQWVHVDETPYLLASEASDVIIEMEADVVLSGSEDGHSDGPEGDDDDENEADHNLVEDLAGNVTKDWDAIQAELDEFLELSSDESAESGSSNSDDNGDGDSEEDGEDLEGETAPEAGSTSQPSHSSRSKRKRSIGSGLDGADGLVNPSGEPNQKKRALEKSATEKSDARTTRDDDSFDEAALEAEIMAALEAESSGEDDADAEDANDTEAGVEMESKDESRKPEDEDESSHRIASNPSSQADGLDLPSGPVEASTTVSLSTDADPTGSDPVPEWESRGGEDGALDSGPADGSTVTDSVLTQP